MEHAIMINKYADLRRWDEKYSYVYLGSDLCFKLLPDKRSLGAVVRFCRNKNLKLVLVTPQVGQTGLIAVKRFLHHGSRMNALQSVVVNDYGILHHMVKNHSSCQIILGRMLGRFVVMHDGSFWAGLGIKRFELDNFTLTRGRRRGKMSYYYPYSIFYSTRYCPFAGIKKNGSKIPGIVGCSKECLDIGRCEIKNPALDGRAFLRGNAQFIERNINLNTLPKTVDRLVFQPLLADI